MCVCVPLLLVNKIGKACLKGLLGMLVSVGGQLSPALVGEEGSLRGEEEEAAEEEKG